MTQVLPDLENSGAEGLVETHASPGVLPYAVPEKKVYTGRTLAVAGIACGVLFVALAVLAGVVHPNVDHPLLALIIATPLAAVVLGSAARLRAKRAGFQERSIAHAAVWIGGVELALIVAFSLMSVSMCRAREPANRAKCSNNLRQIGLAILTYANNHGGQFPDTLNVLLATDPDEYTVTADVFTCPSSSDEGATGPTPAEVARKLTAEPGHLSYVYVGAGLTSVTATADRIVAYDNPHNHNDEGVNVLFGDAHVEFLDRKQAEQAIAKLGRPSTIPVTQPTGASH